MKRTANRKWDNLGRIILFCLWGCMQVLILLMAIAMLLEGVFADGWYMLVFLTVLWAFLICCFLRLVPVVELKEDGIYYRVIFQKRFYPWSAIKQAGILWSMGRYGMTNDLVVLKPGGSKRRYKDKTFLLRNMGKLIHIELTEDNISLIRRYYGPLDFDLSNGRDEASIVVDERISADGETESNL